MSTTTAATTSHLIAHSEFKGHRAPVTCFAGSALPATELTPAPVKGDDATPSSSSGRRLLASGSEDKTVRIWDTRTNKAVKCLHGCFQDAIEAVAFHPADDNLLFAASGNTLSSFDLRSPSVLQNTTLSTLSSFEEINCMDIHPSQRLLAVSDDSNNIYCVPFDEVGQLINSHETGVRYKTLSRVHTNIVGAVKFHVNAKKSELLSGGFDCLACLWDTDRSRPAKSIQYQALEEVISTNQVFNPPFVHSVGYICDGKLIVAGLGDGSLRVSNAKDLVTILQLGAHNGAMTAMSTAEDLVVTGGIDGQVHGWAPLIKPPVKGSGKGKGAVFSPIEDMTKLWTLNHHSKVNAIYARVSEDSRQLDNSQIYSAYEVFVGDVSNTITYYTVQST